MIKFYKYNRMLSGAGSYFDSNNQNNLCCNINYTTASEVIGYRRHIGPKSSEKNQKQQKTSLKKRSGTCETVQETRHQIHNSEPKHQNTPPKPIMAYRQVKPPEPVQIFQHIQVAPAPPPTVNLIRYTPQKPRQNERKINFSYNSKLPVTKFETLGVNDLESFKEELKVVRNQNIESHKHERTQATGFHSQTRVDPFKSTQYTCMASERVGSWDESPGLSRDFRFESIPPLAFSERRQSREPLISLSSRKQTVMSINGDSESQQSIALQDLHPLPLGKYNSIQTSKIIEERNKFAHSSLKTSLNL